MLTTKPTLTPVPWCPMGVEGKRKRAMERGSEDFSVVYNVYAFFFFSVRLYFLRWAVDTVISGAFLCLNAFNF